MKVTLEQWIADMEEIKNEKMVLLEHSGGMDYWNQKYLREQVEMWNDRLAMLYELKGYRAKINENN